MHFFLGFLSISILFLFSILENLTVSILSVSYFPFINGLFSRLISSALFVNLIIVVYFARSDLFHITIL
jgi:hypothetical protein